MDLKKRLAQFDRLTRQRSDSPPRDAGGQIDRGAEDSLCRHLGLQSTQTPWGILWFREHTTRRPTPPAGPWPDLAGLFPPAPDAAGQPEELLFLDTETTGLAGGTGSLAFLVGLGWWAGGSWHIRQYFLPGPGQEIPILKALQEVAQRFRLVVTFNGNGFDLPLLRTRALLSRCEDPCARLASWDLLAASRRLWGRRLNDCRQQTLEVEVCGLGRGAGDIEGSRIPQAYFDYLQTGQPGLIPRVLRHNQRDVRGMALLFRSVLARADALPRGPRTAWNRLSWQDAWANGRVCEIRGEQDLAAAWLDQALHLRRAESAAHGSFPPPERFFRDAVRILKRTGAWLQIEEVIQAGLGACGDRPWLHREAAILYEHRLGRLPEAWHHAQRSGESLRLDRLARKLSHSVE